MKYRRGFHNISEEIRSNENYLRIREIIQAEELARMFENEAQTRLQQYNKVFEQIEKIKGEGFFSHLKTPVDIDTVKELTIKFWGLISPECRKEVEDIFNGVNPNVELIISQDDEKFTANHYRIKIKGGGIQFPEDMLEDLRKGNPELYNEIIEINKEKNITRINISLTGYLNDLYNLIHEITHYFTFRDTATERVLSEVAPQCMERILDDFLLQLSEEELKKYNFKKEVLKYDIRKRRIISFTSRYKAAKNFIKKSNNKGEEEEEFLKYFLAQFFQAQLKKYNKKDRNNKILEFIEHVKNDDFANATRTFGIDWSNKLKRKFYIDNMIEDIRKDFETRSENITVGKNNQKKETNQEKDELVF